MTVKLDDGTKVEAWISDDYLESATPLKVKAAVIEIINNQQNNQREIDELLARVKALGYEIMPKGAVPTPVSTVVAPISPQPGPINESIELLDPSHRLVDGRMADARSVSPNVQGNVSALGGSVSGSGSEYAITSADKPTTDLKEGEQAEIGTVRGRAGMEIAIPVRRVGKTGETRVSVINTGGDAGLQQRFKALASQSEIDPPDFIHGGYQVKTITCGLCRGQGKTMGKECPKCHGAGSYDVEA